MTVNRSPRGAGLVRLFLILAAIVAGAFFFSFWGRNAPGLGQSDAGLALAMSFAIPLTLYISLGLAAIALLATLVSAFRRRPARLWLAALLISLSPAVFLLLIDLLTSAAPG